MADRSLLASDPGPLGVYSAAARRVSDAIAMHIAAAGFSVAGQWAAFRLSDGGTDNVLYPDKATAVRHQLHEFQCAYVKIPPTGMPPREAEIFLAFNRKLYDAGYRMPDPSHHINMPQMSRLEDYR